VPSQWFVKTPSLAIKPRLITALPRFLHKEVRFYRSLSRHVPLKLPRILAAESQLGQGSTLVMSDLSETIFGPGRFPMPCLSTKPVKSFASWQSYTDITGISRIYCKPSLVEWHVLSNGKCHGYD
jgi:hypothetical protein